MFNRFGVLKRLVIAFVFLAVLQTAFPLDIFMRNNEIIEVASSKPIINIFKKKADNTADIADAPRVFAGGMPIGFTINSDGVIVSGVSEVETSSGKFSPAKNAGIVIGDILVSIEGERVESVQDIDRLVNCFENAGRELKVVVVRKGAELEFVILPALDVVADSYKLGLWVKDNAAGVGTITYYREDGSFGALGHPVCDGETGVILPIKEGTCYKCDIIGVNKSAKGKPGELKGLFLRNKNIIGSISTNNAFGIFGTLEKKPESGKFNKMYTVCPRNMVKEGKAKIISTIGNAIDEYEIEIVKAYNQKSPKDKGLVIKVVDQRLIDKTGGIVQGMSGSPIIQGDYIVGAVTHVFVNDPTRGYGMYLDFMLAYTTSEPTANLLMAA